MQREQGHLDVVGLSSCFREFSCSVALGSPSSIGSRLSVARDPCMPHAPLDPIFL